MLGDISVKGRVESFDGSLWEIQELEDFELVDPIGEFDGYAYVLYDGIPIRYFIESEHTFVTVSTEELLFA